MWRRAGAVLVFGGLPLVLGAFVVLAVQGRARQCLAERSEAIDRDLLRQSLRASGRTPYDSAPYRGLLLQLRADPDRVCRQSLPFHHRDEIQEILDWSRAGCPFNNWSAKVDVGFDNRHSPFIFGAPRDFSGPELLLSTAMSQQFFRGGGYASSFHRTAMERKLHAVWNAELPTQRWNPASLKSCIDALDRLEAARPSLREEIETEYLLRARDLLGVFGGGRDPEGLLKDRTPGIRSLYSRTVMVAQILGRLDRAREELLAMAALPWEAVWSELDPTWHAAAPIPAAYAYLDQALLVMEGRSALRRCLLRTALAVEQYGLETGRFPERLEDLVPHYLPDLPRCPLTGVVLSYRDGEVRSPEIDDPLRAWLVRRPDPPAR